MSAGIAGAALAPRGRENEGVAVAVATAVPLAYATFEVAPLPRTVIGLILKPGDVSPISGHF